MIRDTHDKLLLWFGLAVGFMVGGLAVNAVWGLWILATNGETP